MKKNWQQMTHKTSTTTRTTNRTRAVGSFDPSVRLYSDYSYLRRKNITTTPATALSLFERICEEIPSTLTKSDLDSIIAAGAPVYSGAYQRSAWGRTVLTPNELTTMNPYALSYNIDHDTGNQYTTGNKFDAICYYYIAKSSTFTRPYMKDIKDNPLGETALRRLYKISSSGTTTKIEVQGHNLQTYYGTHGKGKQEQDIINGFKIGQTSTLTNIQSIDGVNGFWTYYNMQNINLFDAGTSRIRVYTTGTDTTPPIFPVLMSSTLRFPATNDIGIFDYTVFYIVLAVDKGKSLAIRKLLS